MAQLASPRALGHPVRFRRVAGRTCLSAPPLWREALLLVIAYLAYAMIRVLVPQNVPTAFANTGEILSFERGLGIDVELSLNKALLAAPWLAKAANLFYATAHFAVTLAVLVWLYRRRPEHYRWMRTALLGATGIALIGFWLYPLAPPRFLGGEGFVDPVVALNTFGLYSSPEAGSMTNQYAAMPSMHAGWALWCAVAVVLLARHTWIKVLAAAYPVITVLVILATANHYLLDAVAGIAVTVLALLIAHAWFRGGATLHRSVRLHIKHPAIHHKVSNTTATPAVSRPTI